MTRLLITALCLLGFAAQAQPDDKQLARVDFEQRLGSPLPLDTAWRDEAGRPVRLGSCFGTRPVILAFAYYDCPSLCTLVLNGILNSVRDLRADAGQGFDIVVLSIRPDEPASHAQAKKQTYTLRYGRPGAAKGWHFLTGDAAAIRQVTQAAGFHYLYDPASDQFAHASGILVLTPNGKAARYFMGIEYPPKDLRQALTEASQHRIGSLAQRLLLLCFHYNPLTGRYGLLITRVVQAAGIGTVLLLGGLMLRLNRQAGRRQAP